MERIRIYEAFTTERERQERLKSEGRFHFTAADLYLSHADRFLILGEEVGEVAGAALQISGVATDREAADLRKELIQLGAVVTAWLEMF
jgi:NTP pyrophosphatase (non-canonical NTP hydrolase)